jgi:hypothetical protein
MFCMTSILKQRESVSSNGTASRLSESGGCATTEGASSIDEALAIWQGRSSRQLSREDGREIIENMTGFFRALQEWDHADRADKTNAPVG